MQTQSQESEKENPSRGYKWSQKHEKWSPTLFSLSETTIFFFSVLLAGIKYRATNVLRLCPLFLVPLESLTPATETNSKTGTESDTPVLLERK